MKYIKSYIFFVLTVFALTGCNQYDDLKDDVNDLKDRVALIEQQVTLLNDNLAVISYILDTQHKTISKVEKSADGTQHVITLSNGEKLTLTIGKPGTIKEPAITVGADKMWYVNGISTGVKAVGQDGKNGDGFPEFRVENGKWQVRFGGGLWSDVAGSEGIAPGSLGDQFFESAKVEGNQFVVTMKQKDGEAAKVYNFPIVDALTCSIDPNGNTLNRWGYYEFDPAIAGNERKIFLVKVEGDNPQVTYPQGWRAELKKLETAGVNGNNYQLIVYAPETTQPITRAAADNTKDVTVQVQKGAFWAMAKIPVGLPKVYNTLLEKYNVANESFYVGGLEIDYATYGAATEVTSNMTIPETGGIFIVSANNVTLTYSSTNTSSLSNLVIVPNTSAVTTIKLVVNKQIYFKGTMACRNVELDNQVNDYLLRVNGNGVNLVLDSCEMSNFSSGKGLAVAVNANVSGFSYFEICNSEIRFDVPGVSYYMVMNMDCVTMKYHNNLFYYSGTPSSDEATILQNLKLIQSITAKDVIVTSNTFVDVESATAGDVNKGLLALTGALTGELTINDNLYYYTYRRCATQFFRSGASPNGTIKSAVNNYTYTVSNYSASNGQQITYNTIGSSSKQNFTDTATDFFDTSAGATFDKANGIFIPKDGYKAYGAQRN